MGRVVKKGEPLWLPEDTDLALEWQAEQRAICKGCGQPLEETTHPDAQMRDYATEEITCMGCRSLASTREALSEQESRTTHGVHVYVTKRDWRAEVGG